MPRSEIIARHDIRPGRYNINRETHLLIDPVTGLGVLISDEWCGVGSVEGETYRPHLYPLSADEATKGLAAWDAEGGPLLGEWERWQMSGSYPEDGERYYGDPEDALQHHVARNA